MGYISELEKKKMVKEVSKALKNTTVKIRYEGGEWSPSFDKKDNGTLSAWESYPLTVEKVSKLTLKKYPFAKVSEGDLVLFLPSDTELPLDKSNYEIDYMGNKYEVNDKPQPYDVIQDAILSYIMVGEYNVSNR